MPLLLDAHNDEHDAQAENEGSDNGHAPIDTSPPLDPGVETLCINVLHLGACLRPKIDVAVAESSLRHLSLRPCRDWQDSTNHPN